MSETHENIGRTEALLLLHLLDELPASERESIDQMLINDASLRGMYDQLRSANETVTSSLRRSDLARPIALSEIAAISRRTSRTMNQQHVERLATPVQVAPPSRTWRPRFSTIASLAASIAVFVGFLLWWGNRTDPSITTPLAMTDDPRPGSESGRGTDVWPGDDALPDYRGGFGRRFFDNRLDPSTLNVSNGVAELFSGPGPADLGGSLADAERQFDHLKQSDDLGHTDMSEMLSQ